MRLRNQDGFTLIEVIVVAGIIAILAGVLVPMILKEIDEAKITRAYADVRSISNALIILKKDTGNWPVKDDLCAQVVTAIEGDGAKPAFSIGWDTSNMYKYHYYLPKDEFGCFNNWNGPYMARVNADPWGYSYTTNVVDFYNGFGNPVWIISPGPNGIVDTNIAVASQQLAGDDVGIRLQ